MSVLRWDRPAKVKTVQQWAESYGFEDGPTGGYIPNMSQADQLSWKAKITGKKLGFPQVEIRKTTVKGSQVVIIVNLGDGYNYKYYRAISEDYEKYADFDDYVEQQAQKYYSKYPQNYKTLDEARDFICGRQDRVEEEKRFWSNKYPTKNINVHIATNGPIQMTFDEMQEMQTAIEEAKTALSSLT